MKKTKWLAACIAAMMALALVAGCSSGDDNELDLPGGVETDETDTEEQDTEEPETEEPETEEPGTDDPGTDDDPDSGGQTPTPTPGDEDDDDPTVSVTSVSLNKKTASVTVGKTVTLVATVSPDDATNKAVTWESDNEEVATVDEDGKVTGMSRGKANITVTTADGNHTDSCEVTVNAKPTDYLTIEETTDGWEVTGYLDSEFPNDGNVEIPEGVTAIGARAFYECASLESVKIPDGVKSIGSGAFQSCTSLASVTIPASVESIGNEAFFLCKNLAITYGGTLAQWCQMDNDMYLMWNAKSIKLSDENDLKSSKTLEIPSDVTKIGNSAFNNCGSLESVEIPDSVTSIGDWAFNGCERLTSVEIPSNVESIGDWAFQNCIKLAEVTIGGSVKSIGQYAFGSTNLASVRIPDSVESIGDYAFSYCYKLTKVNYDGTAAQWEEIGIGSDAFGTSVKIYDKNGNVIPRS